jgi:hypothetical protein
MKETPQEYIKRITSTVEGEQSLKVQVSTPKKLERLIKEVSVSKLRKRPAPDIHAWLVHRKIGHGSDITHPAGWLASY